MRPAISTHGRLSPELSNPDANDLNEMSGAKGVRSITWLSGA